MEDWDTNPDTQTEADYIEYLLGKADEAALGEWDRRFVDDLMDRGASEGYYQLAQTLTALQWQQLERIEDQYGIYIPSRYRP